MKRTLIMLVGVALAAIASGELFARFKLGLGDPPISMPDAEIDYIFAPNQKCNRFRNIILYNNASMRCDFDVKPDFQGLRIYVVGDSVVNGGVLTDHKNLATTILQDQIDPSRTAVQICNVSAGSWGPGNYAAYFRQHKEIAGTNDIVIVEVNSHDLWEDDPVKTGGRMVGKDIALPDHKPWCALWDGFNRYFLPKCRRWLQLGQVNTKVDVPRWGMDADNATAKYNLKKLDELYALPWAQKYLLIHRSRKETISNEETAGEAKFREYAASRGINLIYLRLDGDADYRDQIHLSESGQRKMAVLIGSELGLVTK